MHRFFVPPAAIEPAAVYFPMEISRQMATVLHLRPGERVIALDNRGNEYEVQLEIVAPRSTEGRVLAARPAEGEPHTRLTLYLGLTQREKFEWILQKCTEVGVANFVPVISSRGLVQSAAESPARLERWQRILQEAAEQAGRGRIPNLAPALRWEEALRHFQAQSQPGLLAWEEEKSMRISAALREHPAALSIFVGPEGGYSAEEVAQAQAAGLAVVTLGKRILRMETAALVMAALVMEANEG